MAITARRSQFRSSSVRRRLGATLCTTLLLLCAPAIRSQTPAEEDDPPDDLRRRIEELEQRIEELEAEGADEAGDEAVEEPERPHVPGQGIRLGKASWGELNFSVYTYIRYLNQNGLDETYTDAFGSTRMLNLREDLQIQKVVLYFNGWIYRPRLRYLFYVWTSNTSQGLGAQVVLAGYLTWQFNEHVKLGLGISGLPTTRSLRGSWPYWLKEDNRTIADEYFRGSYTTGIWVEGKITERSQYKFMIGNNLSQLGIDAGQLRAGLDTYSGSVWWTPTTGEFGLRQSYGDFEHHDKPATLFGISATRSREDAQSQPGVNDIENSQIRISDGNVVFTPDLFATDVQIRELTYRMAALDAAVKYRGFSLEAELYRRLVDDFGIAGTGTLPFDELDDHGFQVQASAMVVPKTLQVYAGGSKIYGEYGEPSDFSVGLNWFPLKRQELRAQVEALHLDRSPVGNLSIPQVVGGDGWVFHSNLSLYW